MLETIGALLTAAVTALTLVQGVLAVFQGRSAAAARALQIATDIKDAVNAVLNVMPGLARDQVVTPGDLPAIAAETVKALEPNNPAAARAVERDPGLILGHLTLDKDAGKREVTQALAPDMVAALAGRSG